MIETTLTLQTADGASIAARLSLASDPVGGALILHPNPSRRGDMMNPVVTEICKSLQAASWTTMRFSMRVHSDPIEQLALNGQDAHAALQALQLHVAHPVVVGYSWGGLVATRLVMAPAIRTHALAVVSPAFNLLPPGADFTALTSWQRPLLLVAGGADDLCPAEMLRKAPVNSEEATQRVVIEGVDHIWSRGAATKAGEAVATWAATLPVTKADAACSTES